MSLLLQQLNAFAKSAELIEVYRERFTPGALLGRVLEASELVLLLERFDEQYEYDGISAVRPSDISRIRAGDRALLTGAKLAKPSAARAYPSVALTEISAAMSIFAKQFPCVSLHAEHIMNDSYFTGRPLEVEDDVIVFEQWGTLRTADKYRLILRLDELTRVDADGKTERLAALAHGPGRGNGAKA